MLCDNCHQNEATVHIQEIAGKKRRSVHLCAACASQKGMLPGEMPADLDIPKLLMSLAKQALPEPQESAPPPLPGGVCRSCGLTAAEFRKHGRLGCPDCYRFLAAALAPMLEGMHRGGVHAGKRPAGEPPPPPVLAAPESAALKSAAPVPAPEPPPPPVAHLKAALAAAVGKEDYEAAARLRDEIRRREAEKTEDGA